MSRRSPFNENETKDGKAFTNGNHFYKVNTQLAFFHIQYKLRFKEIHLPTFRNNKFSERRFISLAHLLHTCSRKCHWTLLILFSSFDPPVVMVTWVATDTLFYREVICRHATVPILQFHPQEWIQTVCNVFRKEQTFLKQDFWRKCYRTGVMCVAFYLFVTIKCSRAYWL